MDSETVIVTSAFVGMGSTIGGSLATKSTLPPTRMIIGGFFGFMGLAIIAEFAEEVGAGLAIALAGTMFVLYGLPAINQVLKQNPPSLKKTVPSGAPPTALQ